MCTDIRYLVETEDKRKKKRSPQGNSKDWWSPQGILRMCVCVCVCLGIQTGDL